MRDLIFIIGLIVVIVIALKLLMWTLGHVIWIAVVAGGVYLLFRSGVLGRRKS